MAEHRLENLLENDYSKFVVPEDGLSFELDLLARHLDILVLEGAELCFPATVVQAKSLESRIARQIKGNLTFDASNDILIQRKLLNRLERQLDYVTKHNVCKLPIVKRQDTPGDLGKRIYDLLNADNQFAFGSSQINPKYMGRLAEAANMLKDYPTYHLKITGHTDSMGSKEQNETLSHNRADMVARYLMIFGLSAQRINIDSVADSQPFVPGSDPTIRLTNRRVTIQVIENTESMSFGGSGYE